MKLTTLSVLLSCLALTLSAQAESTIKLTGVHNCCGKCEKGIQAAVAKVAGATVVADKGNVTITAKDEATVKKAEASMVAGGYAGAESTVPTVADAKVKTATVKGVHLCCPKCVKAVNEALKDVPGVTKNDATKGVASFKVEGDFSTAALSAALHKGGFSGGIN